MNIIHNKQSCKFLIYIITILFFVAGFTEAAGTDEAKKYRDIQSDTWVATDAIGRVLPNNKQCGSPREEKYVAIFYFQWLDKVHESKKLYDITKILNANPKKPEYGPDQTFHWWAEPYLGYYFSVDEFVIRKHAQMLSDAGVDVIILDVTNGITYDNVYEKICYVFTKIREEGGNTPQITFLTNSRSDKVVKLLYKNFYSKKRYPDLWFQWFGKPLILASQKGLSKEIKKFFTFRRSWAWSDPNGWFGDGKDKWPWIDNYPQNPGWHDSPDKPEEISVCAAQHPTSNVGRSFEKGRQPPPEECETDKGLCFAEQWKRALEVDPKVIFITGWNEWIAQRFINKGGMSFLGKKLKVGETFFVDDYSREYSRDIEPMKGGHGDNYYYQMVAGIRKFKGVRPFQKSSKQKTISTESGFSQWKDVKPVFLDDIGDTAHRNSAGWCQPKPYINITGRNDFEEMKVAADDKMIYFYVRTHKPITKPEGQNWMNLLINTDSNYATGWEGYDYIVNRKINGTTKSLIEKHVKNWEWQPVTNAQFRVSGNEMQLAIPRKIFKSDKKNGELAFDFKWTDNVPGKGDIMDFIDKGDVAPNMRFAYRYQPN